MPLTRLQEDLIKELREEKDLIYEQLAIFDPLGTQLRTPAARRLVSKGALIIAEVFCYLLALGSIALAVFLHKIHPFYILSELRDSETFTDELGKGNIDLLNIGVYALLGTIAVLFFIIARSMRMIRLKNGILNFAGKHINSMVGQHLERKASIENLEQRHWGLLPVMPNTATSSYEGVVSANDVANPGYEGYAAKDNNELIR
jgi:branched-subunit amino acid transport protein AzlD